MSSLAPWLAHYDPDVPATIGPYPSRTLLDYVADTARQRPDHPALLFKGAKVTYGQLDELSSACASAFASLGIRKGDRVALLLPNCPQFFIAELAAWKLGAIVAPLNPIYTERELEGPLREHGIETVVTMTRFYKLVKQVQPRTPVKRVIATNIKEFFPPLLRTLFTLLREKKDGDRVTLAEGDHSLKALIDKHAGRKAPAEPPGPEDAAVLLMSGGTTGTAKGVLGKHSAYVCTGLQIVAWTPTVLSEWNDVIFLPLPMFHVYANVGVQALAFITKNPIALVPNPRDLDDLLATIKRVKPAFFTAVPTLYIALLNHPLVQKNKIDFKSIKICFSGAAALLADTKKRFEALTGARIIEGYALTESMMALCVNPVVGENKLGSVGMPLPDVHIRIFDGDDGNVVMPNGEVGEICFSAPQLMVGYWNRPDETGGVLRDHVDADGTTRRWLHTGDLGYLDPEGYLMIVDRKKDLIKTSGYQVWPREIEEVVASHPAVAEVGVAGVPDDTRGEVVKAWIVLRGNELVSEQDLKTFCRERLAPYKVPASFEFRSELPKTLVGKVLRRALRDGK